MFFVEELHIGLNSWEKIVHNNTKRRKHNSFYGEKGNSELMQFTGLTDKNGEEIYEGDIVWFNVENQDRYYGDNIGYIIYEDYSYAIQTKNSGIKRFDTYLGAYSGSLILVGNFYENPELLDGRK
jgi:uncharacterized phage protein (TIGR01671 family)